MPVHASSVINTSLNVFRPDIYTKITDMEYLCYTTPFIPTPIGSEPALTTQEAVAIYTAGFTQLNSALYDWIRIGREQSVKEFLSTMYGYLTMVAIYGISNSVESSMDSRFIFSANEYFTNIVTKADNFYNEIIITAGALPEDPPVYTTPKFTTDADSINNALALETSYLTSVSDMAKTETSNLMSRLLFEDIPTVGTSSKVSMADKIFNQLHYKEVYLGLNVGALVLPPGI